MIFSRLSLLMITIYCIAPIYLLVKLWKNRSEDLFSWALLASITTVYLLYMYRIGAWAIVFTGYYWRYLLLTAFVIVIFKSYRQTKRRLLPGWFNFRNSCSLFFVGLISITQTIAL